MTTNAATPTVTGSSRVKRGMAEMLKGGVIMDVVTPEQARIAEASGAVAVMALERVPADIRAQGGVSRMSDPDMIEAIISAVTIPVMAKARIGHFVEAQILEALGAGFTSIPAMVPSLYVAVDPRLHPAAALSVLAHMIRLVKTGEVVTDGAPGLDSDYRPA